MRLKFGINFEFKLSRDGPVDDTPHYDGSTDSNIERSPDTDYVPDAGELVGKRVAPKSRPVIGFVGHDIGRYP